MSAKTLAGRIDTALSHMPGPHSLSDCAADVAEVVGVDVRTVNRWRAGTLTPAPSQIPFLAAALAVTPHWLLTGDIEGDIVAPRMSPAKVTKLRRLRECLKI